MTDAVALLRATIDLLDATLLDLADLAERPDAPTPCADWDVADLLTHLESMAGAYVLWGSAVLGGRTMTLRDRDEQRAWNATMVARTPRREPGDLRRRWHDLATDHVRLVAAAPAQVGLRLADETELSLAQHGEVAAIEWWLHSWDLRTARDLPPTGAELAPPLSDAWSRHLSGLHGTVPQVDDPVATLLLASGREPRGAS